jgi:hypothetical protein
VFGGLLVFGLLAAAAAVGNGQGGAACWQCLGSRARRRRWMIKDWLNKKFEGPPRKEPGMDKQKKPEC